MFVLSFFSLLGLPTPHPPRNYDAYGWGMDVNFSGTAHEGSLVQSETEVKICMGTA